MRKHSVDYTFKMIQYVVEKYNINFITFQDELFITGKKWEREFCDKIRESELDIKFRISSRANLITEDIVKNFASVGCTGICVGYESGSQKMLDSMKKHIDVKYNYHTHDILEKYNMIPDVPTIQGMPDETKETIMETLDFIKKCNIKHAAVYYVTPYPNSEIYQFAKVNGLIQNEDKYLDSISNADASELKINLTKMSDKDLIYYHWLLSDALEINRIRDELQSNNIANVFKFYARHYAIKTLYRTPLFMSVWKHRNGAQK